MILNEQLPLLWSIMDIKVASILHYWFYRQRINNYVFIPQPIVILLNCFYFSDGSPAKKKTKKDMSVVAGVVGKASPPVLPPVPSVTPLVSPGVESDGHSSDGDRKRKKARTTFTGRQIFELERQFELKKYLSSSERADMAKLLGVTETQVCNDLEYWVENESA